MVEWPRLPVADWADTRDTLHMWTQIVGKVKLAHAPLVNHWWQVALHLTPRGLTTSAMPCGPRYFDVEFDFLEHVLRISASDGGQRRIALVPKSVADFHAEVMGALDELGLGTEIRPVPNEVDPAVPFPRDTGHASYDADAVRRWWGQLLAAHRVMSRFRSEFVGKVSPVHYFWGAMDLAVTRFSGRTAPRHPGGAPNCADRVMVEGYSHELSSCGFWPGGDGEGVFYAYAYPEPEGFRDHPVTPAEAGYDAQLGEFVLPYEAVRRSADPDETLLGFLRTTYEAAAEHGGWDRAALEDVPTRRAYA